MVDEKEVNNLKKKTQVGYRLRHRVIRKDNRICLDCPATVTVSNVILHPFPRLKSRIVDKKLLIQKKKKEINNNQKPGSALFILKHLSMSRTKRRVIRIPNNC